MTVWSVAKTDWTCVQQVWAGLLPLGQTGGVLATPPEEPTEQ